jgi:hypothetical protein
MSALILRSLLIKEKGHNICPRVQEIAVLSRGKDMKKKLSIMFYKRL